MTYAVFDRHYRWAGLPPGPRRRPRSRWRAATSSCRSTQKAAAVLAASTGGSNQLLLSSFHLSKANLPAYFEALARVPAGGARRLSVDALPAGEVPAEPRRDVSAAGRGHVVRDALRLPARGHRGAVRCRVFDYYALAERVVFSSECERHEGHHIAMEYGIAEVVDADGQPLPRGAVGKLVGTTLHNLAMPLIRYVTNDMTALRNGPCGCGRGLEIMDDVTTKAEDVLTLKDGRLISPSVLTHPFKPLDCIEGSQIVQTAPDAVTVRIVAGAGLHRRRSRSIWSPSCKARLGRRRADRRADGRPTGDVQERQVQVGDLARSPGDLNARGDEQQGDAANNFYPV